MNDLVLAAGAGGVKTGVGIIAYIVIGGIAGWIASKIMHTDAQMGIVLNVVVGVIGAVIAGYVLSYFVDVKGGGYWFTFFVALLGAVVLLAIVKAVTGGRARR
jgi:uncharacterized membrane protein YeaQ/YmgE (transglycosylase-associated protein family)